MSAQMYCSAYHLIIKGDFEMDKLIIEVDAIVRISEVEGMEKEEK